MFVLCLVDQAHHDSRCSWVPELYNFSIYILNDYWSTSDLFLLHQSQCYCFSQSAGCLASNTYLFLLLDLQRYPNPVESQSVQVLKPPFLRHILRRRCALLLLPFISWREMLRRLALHAYFAVMGITTLPRLVSWVITWWSSPIRSAENLPKLILEILPQKTGP